MNRFFARIARHVFARAGLVALVLAAAGGTAQAFPVSISPSGNVPAQSTLTVTWTPYSPDTVGAIILQMAPGTPTPVGNPPILNFGTGSLQMPLPASLHCGPNYEYQVLVSETLNITPEIIVNNNWNNNRGSSANFTIKCPRSHPLSPSQVYKAPPNPMHIDTATTGPSHVDNKVAPNLVHVDKATPNPPPIYPATAKVGVKVSCPPGSQVEDGKCVASRDSNKARSRPGSP